MRRSHTISLFIDYPYQATYRFLADPRNYGEWAAVDRRTYRPLDNGDWEGMTGIGGMRHFRFTPANAFGVLDHAVFVPGETPLWTPMRVTPNEEGTDLVYTFYQRPGMSDEVFASAIEWITTDFLALKALLEARCR
jgi:hypothetical protein